MCCPAETADRRRILVICCSNNELHVAAVTKLIKFLEAKCNVSVAVVDNNCAMCAETVQDWLMEEIELAKKVVIFHSRESIAMAWHFTRSAVTQSVALKAFMTALEMFSHSRVDQSKLLNVYFSYTPFDCVVNINCGCIYQLMSEFDNFLTNVQGSASSYHRSVLMCHEAHELQHAINDAARYAEAHPHDFGFLPPESETDSIETQSLVSRLAAEIGCNISECGLTHLEMMSTSETATWSIQSNIPKSTALAYIRFSIVLGYHCASIFCLF